MTVDYILIGAIIALSAVISLFFIKYWRSTRDRFFLFFALAFFIEGANRLLLGIFNYGGETQPAFYLLRLIAYGLILFAIYDKNRRPK